MWKLDMYKIFHNSIEYFKDFITRYTYHSNAIEGNTYAIIFNDNSYVVKAEPRAQFHIQSEHIHPFDDENESLVKNKLLFSN